MPFKSQAQRRFMYSQEPKLAKQFEKETPKGKKLPEKVKKENKSNVLINGKEVSNFDMSKNPWVL